MPYVYDKNIEEDEKALQDAAGAPPSQTGGDTSATASDGAQFDASKPTSSGKFQNLDSYLNANEGQNFGESVAAKVGDQVTQAKSDTQSAASQFSGKVDQGTTKYDDDVVKGAVADPTAYASDEAKLASFTKQRDANYAGPKSSAEDEDYRRAYEQSQKAYRQSEASKSEGGRFALLDEYFRRPDYSQGQKTLDNLLVQNDPGSREAFGSVQTAANDVPSEYQASAQRGNNLANQGQAATQAAREKTRAAIGVDDAGNLLETSLLATERGSIDKSVLDENARVQASKKSISDNIFSSGLTDEQLALLGLSRGSESYGINPTDYLQSAVPPTADQITSKEQQAKLAALAKLAGAGDSYVTDATKAGSYDPSKAITFDKGGYERQVGTQKAGYESALNGRRVTYTNQLSRPGSPAAQFEDSLPNAISRVNQDLTESQALIASKRDTSQFARDYVAAMQQELQRLTAIKDEYDTKYGAKKRVGG